MRKAFLLIMAIILAAVAAGTASAQCYEIQEVEVGGTELAPGTTTILAQDRNEDIEVRVQILALCDQDNVQVEAMMRGYDHDDRIEDITDVFDVQENRTYVRWLNLRLPLRMDVDQYKLRVLVTDRNHPSIEASFDLEIGTARHQVGIRDVIFEPGQEVQAGRSLITSIRLKNYGAEDEDDIKVSVAIPALGLYASDYIDEVEADESRTSEELYMRIPMCATPGSYTLEAKLTYDDGDEYFTETYEIVVEEGEGCAAEAAAAEKAPMGGLSIEPTLPVSASAGGSASIPLLITNHGTAGIFQVSVPGMTSYGSYTVTPSHVLEIGAGATEVAIVTLGFDAGVSGDRILIAEVGTVGGEDRITAPLIVSVQGSPAAAQEGIPLRTVLLAALAALLVVLVVLAALALARR
ncbi:hypothetical protein JXB02_04790 [Candidatus Woesearchaeota archaeon]|nr:hypothetical protein [Candidatus Woesearchaeota archaeon]